MIKYTDIVGDAVTENVLQNTINALIDAHGDTVLDLLKPKNGQMMQEIWKRICFMISTEQKVLFSRAFLDLIDQYDIFVIDENNPSDKEDSHESIMESLNSLRKRIDFTDTDPSRHQPQIHISDQKTIEIIFS